MALTCAPVCTQPGEKPNAAAMFDGEMAREKSVVARVRELRLRAQANERKKSARPESAKTDAGDGDDGGVGHACLSFHYRFSIVSAPVFIV